MRMIGVLFCPVALFLVAGFAPACEPVVTLNRSTLRLQTGDYCAPQAQVQAAQVYAAPVVQLQAVQQYAAPVVVQRVQAVHAVQVRAVKVQAVVTERRGFFGNRRTRSLTVIR